ncbi:hypothetical protein FHS32_000229 [Streptomyces albaduncus]|uniref:Uncharacterized protein n=1 Tax=Streptomyces griseoloalbus TaxID=67303 RepID=A0A7W8BHM5_9ACTN|nr:hypothetical protein [Streptomyces albaduncus]
MNDRLARLAGPLPPDMGRHRRAASAPLPQLVVPGCRGAGASGCRTARCRVPGCRPPGCRPPGGRAPATSAARTPPSSAPASSPTSAGGDAGRARARRRALWCAVHGIDVGPRVIHGVEVTA